MEINAEKDLKLNMVYKIRFYSSWIYSPLQRLWLPLSTRLFVLNDCFQHVAMYFQWCIFTSSHTLKLQSAITYLLEPYLLLVLSVSSLFHSLSYSKTPEYVTCFASMLKPFFNIHSRYKSCFIQGFVVSRTRNSIKLAQVKGFLRVVWYVISRK